MNQLRKILVPTLAILLAGVVFSSSAFSQTLKMGFVKDDVIKQRFNAWIQAQEQWDLETKAWEEEALSKQKELEELQEEYNRQKLILSDEKKKEREAALGAKMDALDAFTRQIFGPNGTAERKHALLIKPLLESITNAIEAIAVEKNYDIIFTLQSGLGYIKEDYDMTDEVLAYLEDNEG